MHRPTVGVIALVLLIAGAVGRMWPPSEEGVQQVLNACWRVGFVLAAVWLALPQTRQINKRLLAAVLATAVLLALRPRLFPFALGFLLLFALLRPRLQRRSPDAKGRRTTDPTKN